MFKRKCHKQGQAVVQSAGLLIMCECITAEDIQTILDWNEYNV